jgi:hypothetical protein
MVSLFSIALKANLAPNALPKSLASLGTASLELTYMAAGMAAATTGKAE